MSKQHDFLSTYLATRELEFNSATELYASHYSTLRNEDGTLVLQVRDGFSSSDDDDDEEEVDAQYEEAARARVRARARPPGVQAALQQVQAACGH